ncbi:unnamed protein product [Victoria cruziana]
MAKPWGGIGAWAAEVEREEQEGQLVDGSRLAGESTSFPSLKEAAAKPKKKKQVMTLSEFQMGGPPGGSRSSEPKGLTPEEMFRLPTGPRERSEGEEYSRLGGGFRSYGGLRMDDGGGRGGGRWDRRDQADGSWGSGGGGRPYGGFAEERRAHPPRASEPDLPSRADEVDNWYATKKSLGPPPDSLRSHERYASLGGVPSSKADDVDNWNAGKSIARSGGSFGSGFRDWPHETERRRIVLNPPSREAVVSEPSKSRPNPFGSARPREEVLAEKGLDWRKLDSDMDSRKSSRPASEHSSRPSSAHSSRPDSPLPQPEVVQKPKPRINPFGDAKPREVLLEERGKDWRKIEFELEHRAVDRQETLEERLLKDEINQLKEKLSTDTHVPLNGESDQDSGRRQTLQGLAVKKERELQLLVRELDDKVRFGQRGNDRPGSGASRTGVGYLEGPSSQSGVSKDSRSVEFAERPHSRGSAPDVWTRTDNGRGFRGTKDRSFIVHPDADRLRSKERW